MMMRHLEDEARKSQERAESWAVAGWAEAT